MNSNPYLADPYESIGTEAEAQRYAHLNTERNLRATGLLMWLVGVVLAIGCAVTVVVHASELAGVWVPNEPLAPEVLWVIIVLLLVCGLLGIWLCVGGARLRRLERSGRRPAFAMMILLGFSVPIGTILAIAISGPLFARETPYILSSGYRQVVAATPTIDCRLSFVMKFAFTALIFVIAIALVGGVLATFNR